MLRVKLSETLMLAKGITSSRVLDDQETLVQRVVIKCTLAQRGADDATSRWTTVFKQKLSIDAQKVVVQADGSAIVTCKFVGVDFRTARNV
jgi:hypothetical protein